MKILLVSSFLPFPLLTGGNIRLYNLIKYLSKNNQITLICEKREHQTETDLLAISKYCNKVLTVKRKKQWSLINVLKTGLSQNSFLITGHTLPEMKKIIAEILSKEKFDLIHCETSYVFQNIPRTNIPIVLTEHNIEYLIYKRYADSASLLLRFLLNKDVLKLKRCEEKFWQQAARVITVSRSEEKIIKKFTSRTSLVPNGVDLVNFKFQISNFKLNQEEKTILFIGDFKYLQNRDAARFIIKEIWPLVKEKYARYNLGDSLKLWIVGRSIPKEIKQLSDGDSIILAENSAQSTVEIFHAADILLAPIRIGGGTQYKILEAMAAGTPVVTNSIGHEGLDVLENRDLLVSDTSEDLAEATVGLLIDKKKYESVANNARSRIEENYDWEKIGRQLEEVYQKVLNDK